MSCTFHTYINIIYIHVCVHMHIYIVCTFISSLHHVHFTSIDTYYILLLILQVYFIYTIQEVFMCLAQTVCRSILALEVLMPPTRQSLKEQPPNECIKYPRSSKKISNSACQYIYQSKGSGDLVQERKPCSRGSARLLVVGEHYSASIATCEGYLVGRQGLPYLDAWVE